MRTNRSAMQILTPIIYISYTFVRVRARVRTCVRMHGETESESERKRARNSRESIVHMLGASAVMLIIFLEDDATKCFGCGDRSLRTSEHRKLTLQRVPLWAVCLECRLGHRLHTQKINQNHIHKKNQSESTGEFGQNNVQDAGSQDHKMQDHFGQNNPKHSPPRLFRFDVRLSTPALPHVIENSIRFHLIGPRHVKKPCQHRASAGSTSKSSPAAHIKLLDFSHSIIN